MSAARDGAGSRARIVATIGPATSSPEALDALLASGIDVARVNCAHGTREELAATVARLRDRAEARGVPLAILADLAGPKLRIGRLDSGSVTLEPERDLVLTTAAIVGDARRIPVDHADLPLEVTPGEAIHLADGMIRLRVLETSATAREIRTRVEVGGSLAERKGLAAPSAGLRLPPLGEKDLLDLDVLVAAGVDYVGLSFVRSESDVLELRDQIARRGGTASIVAKIEKARAVERIDAIARVSDAVMVARGDLGVECPIEDVAVLQKRILETCRRRGTPAITATQMLESMTKSWMPTRAEATDVANAVLDGSDALMLSEETAVGRYPVEAVRTMRRIAASAEAWRRERPALAAVPSAEDLDPPAAIGRAACLAADELHAGALVCLTQSGGKARALARWRPSQPILAVTAHPETQRRLRLVWGIEAVAFESAAVDFDETCRRVARHLRDTGRVAPGRRIVVTAGLPFPGADQTNTLRVETV